jgi:hypothetical protein
METQLEHSLYHKFLRVSACVFAFVLVFDSGLLHSSTAGISNLTAKHMASVVGVSVGVAPTELNQLTGRITELETELAAKERLIAVNVQNNTSGSSVDRSTFILSAILFILLLLIVLNYALDFVRDRRVKIESQYEESNPQVA